MAIRINSNVDSIFAQKNLARVMRAQRDSMARLSSGVRITKAADDAAGLAISEKMRAQIKSLKMAQRNTQNGISMVQTAEGALEETNSILSRMRELAVESSSEVLQATERAYLQSEFAALQTEMERIADSTEFNGLNLSDGSTTSVDVQVGIFNTGNDRIEVALQDSQTATLGVDSGTIALTTASTSQSAITAIDTAIDSVNSSRATYGAVQNRLTSVVRSLENYTENLIEAESRIRDVDFAAETATMTRNQIFAQAAISVLAQANSSPQAALSLLG